jgi:hypothetical protein
MDKNTHSQLPLGARVLPGVDLPLWLSLIATACAGASVVTLLAWVRS